MNAQERVGRAQSAKGRLDSPFPADKPVAKEPSAHSVALFTGGHDRSYALGLASSLRERGIALEVIGSDNVDAPEFHGDPGLAFLNLRGDQSENAPASEKVRRLLTYYWRLLNYAATAKPRVFHVLWNNKFEVFDRTLLMLYYRAMGRRVVLTAHNVNAAKRDGHDNALNRLSLRCQYSLADCIFVHTQKMKQELSDDFGVPAEKIQVIPFGINNTSPNTALDRVGARDRLGIPEYSRTVLFFGQIAPYKGLEYLVEAVQEIIPSDAAFRLVIAGKVKKGHEDYWKDVDKRLESSPLAGAVVKHIRHIPDEDVEVYFKAADVLAVPYTEIFQSGVPFLAYSFGLPVIATDVGALREDIVEGKTGYICPPRDSKALGETISQFFEGPLGRDCSEVQTQIKEYANKRYSWQTVARLTESVYGRLSPTID